jgi:hypothetical protein
MESYGPQADEYCNICNPFQYDTSIMSHPDQVKAHIQDVTVFELYVKRIVDLVQNSPYWDNTAISAPSATAAGITSQTDRSAPAPFTTPATYSHWTA